MAWVAVDEDGGEWIYSVCPIRFDGDMWVSSDELGDDIICLPNGSIEKLIGRKLTWDDEPVEL